MNVALIALVAVGIVAPRQQSPERTLDRAIDAYARIHTARATFTQRLTNPLTGQTTVTHGDLQQRKPGRFDVRFTDPAGDRIVSDGKVVWVYLPSTNPGQVIKMRAGENGAGVPDYTAQFLETPKSKYTVTDAGTVTIGTHATHAITLVPKDASLPFSKAIVWVDDDDALVRQFETTEQNGITRRVTIDTMRPNAKLDADAFVFKVPSDVHVFEQ